MVYSNNYRILSVVCDNTDHLHLWGLARLFQECAEEHTALTHIGFHDLLEQNKAWILSRMLYRIERMPAMGERVTISTWSRGCDGLFAFREFTMDDEQGNRIAAASSYWAVIDFTSRRAIRIPDLMKDYEHHPESATGVLILNKLRPSNNIMSTSNEEEESSVGENITNLKTATFGVYNSSLDHTNHVNNAEYLRWLSDFFNGHSELTKISPTQTQPEPNPNKNVQIFELEINYLLETRLNEQITVTRLGTENTSQYFDIRNPRGISALIRLQVRKASN